MQGKRTDRVAHLIQTELSQIVVTRLKDPRAGFLTVTKVDVTPDLKNAFVYFSVMGEAEKKEAAKAALEKARGFLQRELASSLKLRYTPHLEFRLDTSYEKGVEIDSLLQTIHGEEEKEEES